MATYVVGDIQGCFQPLKKLLAQVEFNPATDVLWCCGDVVNRGPESLAVLRFLKSLGESCICVLGNHDIQLLAYAAGGKSFKGDTLDEVLAADDAGELIDWLRFRPMLHHDEQLGWCMVHAGLSPRWSLDDAKQRAAEIEGKLRSEYWGDFCRQLQSTTFPTQDAGPDDQSLFSMAVFTRTRYCQNDGVFDWTNKTAETDEAEIQPWFAHEDAQWKKACRVVYGHWAARGLVADEDDVLGLDTGCVWGGRLTMARLDGSAEIELFSQPCAGIKASKPV